MADTKKKKIKVKKASRNPIPINPSSTFDDTDQYIDSDFQSLNDEKIDTSFSKQRDDDEFEKLLNDFLSNEMEDIDEEIENIKEDIDNNQPSTYTPKEKNEDSFIKHLAEEELALFTAYKSFEDAILQMANKNKSKSPEFLIKSQDLYPRYKPKYSDLFVEDTIKGWDIMIKSHPKRIATISPVAKDEDLLDFAEKTTDELLQLAVISYVEILIEMESCEIAYEARRLKAQRKMIEKKVYDEHQARQDKIKRYIKAINDKKLPIDGEKLIVNYFKTARKDPDGAYKMLVNNPATYSPIDIKKIPDRWFGLVKSTPQDGIRWNKIIGDFLKKLKA